MTEGQEQAGIARPNVVLGRAAQIFPKLTKAQIDRIAAVGRQKDARPGEVLFDQGEQNTRFFVVLSGAIEVVRPVATLVGTMEEPVVMHGPGEFTGEINMLSARRSLVRARTSEVSSLVVVDRDDLRRLVQRDSELSEILMRAFILRRVALVASGSQDLVLVGSRHSADTMRIKEFLSRNGQPFAYDDVETDPDVQALLDRFQVAVDEVPVVICQGGHIFKNPSVQLLSSALGLAPEFDPKGVRDVVVVGAGPAGLAAAVYGASEGLDVLVLESTAPGGQAGTSSRIENYLGFPTGISGQALAGRALTQAEKFGADVAIGRHAVRLECQEQPYRVLLSDGTALRTRAVVLATGAKYRRLGLSSSEAFEGAGVYYSATFLEGQLCDGQEIVVVGGGNSAGQAAVFLSQVARRVHLLVRGRGLADSMSRYLIQRIESSPKIDLYPRCQVESLEGEGRLERVAWRNADSGDLEKREVGYVFVMTGADPNTDWLDGCLQVDDKRFVKTGVDLLPEDLAAAHWPLARSPYLLETSIPGVFCAGDARSTSVKRVASAVGEGAMCVQMLHRALSEL